MRFEIDRIKNTLMLLTTLVLNSAFIFFILGVLPISFSHRILLLIMNQLVWLVCIFRIVYDYRAYIEINDLGIVMFRRGKYHTFLWKEIKRVSYSGIKKFLPFDVLFLNTTRDSLYIEYNFSNYKEIWSQIIDHYQESVPHAIIDADVPH